MDKPERTKKHKKVKKSKKKKKRKKKQGKKKLRYEHSPTLSLSLVWQLPTSPEELFGTRKFGKSFFFFEKSLDARARQILIDSHVLREERPTETDIYGEDIST